MRHSFLIQILIHTCLSLTLAACQSPTPPTPEQDSTQANTEAETLEPVEVEYRTVQNPVGVKGDDPRLVAHGNDYYYCFA